MYAKPRAATVRCSQAGVLWGLDRAGFRTVQTQADVLDMTHVLRRVEVLSSLRFDQLQQIRDMMVDQEFAEGTQVVVEGDAAEGEDPVLVVVLEVRLLGALPELEGVDVRVDCPDCTRGRRRPSGGLRARGGAQAIFLESLRGTGDEGFEPRNFRTFDFAAAGGGPRRLRDHGDPDLLELLRQLLLLGPSLRWSA